MYKRGFSMMARARKGFTISNQESIKAAEFSSTIINGSKDKDFLGNIHVTLVNIEHIHPDPNNPRKILLTPEEIKNEIHRPDTNFATFSNKISALPEKLEQLNQLKRLADSIKSNGLINAIVAYKQHDTLYIVTGERRFLACVLLGYTSAPVKILRKKPDELQMRIIQWDENDNREDLSTWDKLLNIDQVRIAYERSVKKNISARKLADLLKIGKSISSTYINLLKLDDNSTIKQALKNNKLKSIESAEYISKISNAALQDKALAMACKGIGFKQIKQRTEAKPVENKRQTIIRPKNNEFFSKLIQATIEHDDFFEKKELFNKINWDSESSLNKAWGMLVSLADDVSTT